MLLPGMRVRVAVGGDIGREPRHLGAKDSACLSISTITILDHLVPSSAAALAPDDASKNVPSQAMVLPAPRIALGRALLSAPQVYEEGEPGSRVPSQLCRGYRARGAALELEGTQSCSLIADGELVWGRTGQCLPCAWCGENLQALAPSAHPQW